MEKLTNIEERAIAALDYAAFPLNIREIRNNVKALLSELQRYGFFNEYTTHSFDHVQAMLEMADWIIPEDTKPSLTPGDYLFLTLAIYFHDLGLLISRDEYNDRHKNLDYKKYISEPQSIDDNYLEYINKLNKLPEDERERILYQEYVRLNHGARVRSWIEGTYLEDNDPSRAIRDAIHQLIGKLEPVARSGLAILCESHTTDDIADIGKYHVSMPYGEKPEETVNLQYTAIILRTVDLLQITKSRAPSVLYQVINPKDPVSQTEWQKQSAVRSIRAAPGKDRDGRASLTAQSDTIQVFARFEKAEGFFGLSSYLQYVKKQLAQSQDALKQSEHHLATPPKFPWKYIDDTHVEAVGFLTDSFGFELDQHKILDLLTGHTLYNDTNVVIRELTQNSLDAIRLQAHLNKIPSENYGRIDITWDSANKILEVTDNGTGMSQDVIESHLLKVGSSRYQDPKFRESHPEFTSISRFGIGVLSAFMVADDVEITTCSQEDAQIRQITLRSVHGKYLIKLIEKHTEKKSGGLYPNGTRIKLTLRSTATIDDILEVTRSWLMFPKCQVYVTIDQNPPIQIGFNSPKEALEYEIANSKSDTVAMLDRFEVRQVEEKGITLAFAVERDRLFNDWSYVQPRTKYYRHETDDIKLSTCVEGVGVVFTTPGFRDTNLLAIANVVGKGAPKTNVARSALEDTAEYRETLKTFYKMYANHVTLEINRLSATSDYSLSRAVEQAPFIAAPLLTNNNPIRPQLFEEALATIPFILLEENGKRKHASLNELRTKKAFWTITSPLTSSVEFLVRESPKDVSASDIIVNLQDENHSLPKESIICNLGANSYIERAIKNDFEPIYIDGTPSIRRISMKWQAKGDSPRWLSLEQLIEAIGIDDNILRRRRRENSSLIRRRDYNDIAFPIAKVDTVNLDDFGGFIAHKMFYIHPSEPVTALLNKIFNSDANDRMMRLYAHLYLIGQIRDFNIIDKDFSVEFFDRMVRNHDLEEYARYVDKSEFVETIRTSQSKIFNPFAWKRREMEGDE